MERASWVSWWRTRLVLAASLPPFSSRALPLAMANADTWRKTKCLWKFCIYFKKVWRIKRNYLEYTKVFAIFIIYLSSLNLPIPVAGSQVEPQRWPEELRWAQWSAPAPGCEPAWSFAAHDPHCPGRPQRSAADLWPSCWVWPVTSSDALTWLEGNGL